MSYPTYPNTYKKDIKVGDKVIHIEVGKFSQQVSAAVLATCGETVVHTTIAVGREVDLGYFPLSVEFAEKLYAGGIIKGSQWVKRDGRPTDDAILKGRIIDRTMRPLFPDGIKKEVQIINTVLSFDKENDPEMIGLVATAVGLSISTIPFDGPIAGLRVGYTKDQEGYVINPTLIERDNLDLDLIVSGSGDSIVMVEAAASEVEESVLIGAFKRAQEELGKICSTIEEIAKEIGREKFEVPVAEAAKEPNFTEIISKKYSAEVHTLVEKEGRLEETGMTEVIAQIAKDLNKDVAEGEDPAITEKEIGSILHDLMKIEARRMILEDGVRPDGRKTDEIRPIWCEIDVLPRTHGSAMFKRGATQALTITTLGSPAMAQHIEDIEGESLRHYMHHYNMPPYASGEAGRFGFPKRREIGHGALAERAILPMIPSQENFPYTIHVVTEIMSSNGSTSMASVCGSTMSLMSAGVPLKQPVAGIAMGLITDGKGKYVVLSDIQGVEDHIGDMDFKVAGTKNGVNALQMDIKIKGVSAELLEQALEQAKVGRLHIMGKMMEAISEPKTQISKYAPKIVQITIPAGRIGELIGPGGKMIKSLIEKTGAEIEVDEDEDRALGLVNITSPDQEKIDHAAQIIGDMMRVVEIGEEFDGPVVRIENYGAFVTYLPGRDGLVHVSQMATSYVNDPEDIVKLGDIVHVRITEIQDDGKIKLSMLTPEEEEQVKSQRAGGEGRPPRDGQGGGFGGGRDGRSGGGRPPFRGGRSFDRGRDRGTQGGFQGDRRNSRRGDR